MNANSAAAKRNTAGGVNTGRRVRRAGRVVGRRRVVGAGTSIVRSGLARIGEREIAALLQHLEGEDGHEPAEVGREEIIDPGFDDMPGIWEVFGLANAGFRPWPSSPVMTDDGDDVW